MALPPVPASFKPIKPYLTRAEELDGQTREVRVAPPLTARERAVAEGRWRAVHSGATADFQGARRPRASVREDPTTA